MHSGITVKLFLDRFNLITLAKHGRAIRKKSSDRLQFLRSRNWTFEDVVKLTFSAPSSSLRNRHPSHPTPMTLISSGLSRIGQMFERKMPVQPFVWFRGKHRNKVRSRVRFRNERVNFFTGVCSKWSSVMFSIFPNISGKFSRLWQYPSLSCSREVNLIGGKFLSLEQPSASKILSFSKKPTDGWMAYKLSQSLNDNFCKCGTQDTSGICVKCWHESKFRLVRFTNFCNIKCGKKGSK